MRTGARSTHPVYDECMKVQRAIAALALLALLASQVSLASARAACAMPRPASCERCAGDTPVSGPTLKADQACCRVAVAPMDRDVARLATPTPTDSRPVVAVLAETTTPPATYETESRLSAFARSVAPIPIPLRATILLI